MGQSNCIARGYSIIIQEQVVELIDCISMVNIKKYKNRDDGHPIFTRSEEKKDHDVGLYMGTLNKDFLQ